MAFTAPDRNLPRPFSKKQSGGRRSYPRDMLAEVLEYDLPHNTMLVKRLPDGQELEVSIDSEKVTQAKRRQKEREQKGDTNQSAGAWSGVFIDADMARTVEKGTWVIIEAAKFQKKVKVGDKKRFVMEANWIHQVPANSYSKALQGILTLDTFNGHVERLQFYGESGNPLNVFENEDELKKLAKLMDEKAAEYQPGEFSYRMGVRFRALLETDETKTVYNPETQKRDRKVGVAEVVDTTPKYDWDYTPADESDTGEAVSKPLSGQSVIETLNSYIDYLEDRFKSAVDAGKITVEVIPFKSYKAGSDKSFNASSERSRTFKMGATPMRMSIELEGEEEEFYAGSNFAVKGLATLVGDKAVINEGQATVSKQYLGKAVFLNGPIAPLNEMIWAADGRATRLHPDLKPKDTRSNANTHSSDATDPVSGQDSAQPNNDASGFSSGESGNPFLPNDGEDAYGSTFETFDGGEQDSAAPQQEQASQPTQEQAPAPALPRSPIRKRTALPASRLLVG